MSSDIPLSARIFAIADVFDALTSRRPYKEAFPLDQSMTIMVDGRGHHFDPSLLDLFLGRCEKLYNEVNEKDAAALKKLLTSCTCHYLDGVL